ncbi:class E sortase [Bifidobacterium sp.]|uniref:class E sortase n=1 Tax=Bifidobacterium sp. TaxID=41200 RepID=UPI0025B7B489|nr:class E sortase [Bifidobacterium sp.]MCI1634879.1 class E sortase [Bifidobacterium sp.]
MARHARTRRRQSVATKRSAVFSVLGILGEILLTLAAVCALYIVWQLWWTGVESSQSQLQQRQSVSWSAPASKNGSVSIASAQAGDPPVQPSSANEGDLVGELYVPRFGSAWQRNIVEGTSNEQLAKHGLGHYHETQMPGQLGNFAVAGHRSGYGEPLAHVDELQEGDAIVVRTKDYWYVYHYTSHTIVLPNQTDVVAANPENPSASATKRMITLTTCEPRYTSATHRWISWGEFDYWAKVSDGVPKEIAGSTSSAAATFSSDTNPSVLDRLTSLAPVVMWLLIAYLVISLAAIIAWRYPVLRDIRNGVRPRPEVSMYGWLTRHQPGIRVVRLLLMLLLVLAATAALFQWVFPWLATNVPYLQLMSNYVSVE